MAKAKRFMDGGAIPNTYPFANQNMQVPPPEDSVQVGSRPEPLGNVMGTQENVAMFKKGGMINPTPQDVPEPAPQLTDKRKRENALAYEKQEKEKKAKQGKTPEGHKVPGTDTYHVDERTGYAKGGAVKSSASRRADGCATKGKTKGRMV